jgi:surface-anchored protein
VRTIIVLSIGRALDASHDRKALSMTAYTQGASARRVRTSLSRWLAPAPALVMAVGLVALAPSAAAETGPAPAPTERTVLSKVHTDAISTFLDQGGSFSLGTKADTPDTGTRYDPATLWFHVDDSSRQEVPGSEYDFIAPAGTQVWIAPESNPDGGQLWAGFSTEGVPSGAVAGNSTSFTLTDVRMPAGGSVEVFTGGGAAAITRRWSSDENHKTFTLGRTHSHANWAFTRPGIYELDVRAQVTLNGAPVSDTATYTFVVGPLPEQAATTTALTVSDDSVTHGSEVSLSADVTPSSAAGAVEFRRGTTVIGHDRVEEGVGELVVPDLPVGTHTITASFVPEVTNLAAGSTSDAVTVTVTDGSGVPFGVAGVQASYLPGDTLTATPVGYTLGEQQRFRWLWRAAGESEYATFEPSETFSRKLSASDDGYELAVSVWSCEFYPDVCGPEETELVAQSAWVPVDVGDLGDPLVAQLAGPATALFGETGTLSISGRAPAPGETRQVVRRAVESSGAPWQPVSERVVLTESAARIYLESSGEFAVRVLDEHGLALTQSEPIRITVEQYEVQIAGVRGVYRPGATLRAQGIVHPENPNLRYRWLFHGADGQQQVIGDGTGSDALSVEIPDLSLEHHGALYLVAWVPIGPPFAEEPGWAQPHESQAHATVSVQDVDPGEQIFQFQPLGEHYHQGNPIDLVLGADPEPAAHEFVSWEWKFPDSEEWQYVEGAGGLSHRLIAEQGLDAVQVRATLYTDEGGVFVADPVTVRVDDHGAPARQVPSIGGRTSFVEGEGLALERVLPANGQTALSSHRWERRAAGSQEWAVVEGQTGAELAVAATLADDGASYRVAVVKPGGTVAYGPSAPVTVSVTPETGTGFGLAGVATSYEIGDVLRARVIGRALVEGQSWRFEVRPPGTAGTGATTYGDGDYPATQQGRLRQTVDASWDGYQVRARLRQSGAYVEGADTGWVTIDVATSEMLPPLTFPAGPLWHGEEILLPFDRDLAGDESVRLAYRQGGQFYEAPYNSARDGAVAFMPSYAVGAAEYALQLIRDGHVVAVSNPVAAEIRQREALVEGVQGVYRVWQTLTATAEVFPPLTGATYRWFLVDADGDSRMVEEGTGAAALRVEMPMSADLDRASLLFEATIDHPEHGRIYLANWSTELRVSTAGPEEQLFFFESLSGHYHQGYDVDLDLVADPVLSAGDTVSWEWRWPDGQWAPFPGASGLSHHLIAEQALNGVEVRATLDYAAPGKESITADPVTIHHDDHGGAARQQPRAAGDASVTEGELVTLTRELPENGQTILTEHRWERKVRGGEWTVLPGDSGAELSFMAAADDDGASYRVSILKPTGSLAYGPSPAMTLVVTALPELQHTLTPSVTGVHQVGQTLTAVVAFTAEPDAIHYQWMRNSQEIDGATGPTYRLSSADLGAEVHVRVWAAKNGYRDAPRHSSSPGPRVAPAQAGPNPVATSVSGSGSVMTFGQPGRLVVSVSPAGASGPVAVDLPGSAQGLTGSVVNGRAVIAVPGTALEPGRRTVRIDYLGVAGAFEPSSSSTVLRVNKARSKVRIVPRARVVERGRVAVFDVSVRAANVDPRGTIIVKLAGRRVTATLDDDAKVRVRVPVGSRISPGTTTLTVRYAGEAHVDEATARTRVRVVRQR